MNLLEGLKIIWSDPEMRKTAIKGVAAVAATGVATYAVTRAATRKQRKANEAYLAEPKTTMVDGELYKKMPDGTLVPYFARDEQDSGYDDYEEYEDCEAYEEQTDDVIYIKGRPYVMDDRGNYVPVRMPSRGKRKRSLGYCCNNSLGSFSFTKEYLQACLFYAEREQLKQS